VIHISDLHCGKRAARDCEGALVALCDELGPDLVIASGDLSNRGRVEELERARGLFERLSAPVLAVPGNHDIPYSLPGRFSHPWRAFEQVLGTTEPVFRSDGLVACGLNSVRPWRHQGGRLSVAQQASVAGAFRAAPAGALRIVALHHHLAGAPWRASRKFPLKHRDAALEALSAAGAELVVGGHIHQAAAAERHEFEALDGHRRGSLVLATAPGFSRPRPRRLGEAQGLQVYRASAGELLVETRIWDGATFTPTAARTFPRRAHAVTGVGPARVH
jgi:3',5'-cyclic AMP phosphodiesterase CpdA